MAQEAGEKRYEISNLDVTIRVAPDGSYDVEEAITYELQAGTFTYAFRTLGADADQIRNVQVDSPDAEIDSLRRTDASPLRLRWTYPPREEPFTVRVRYTVRQALRERGGENEVRWNALATDATTRTRDVDVRVLLPAAFSVDREDLSVTPPADAAIMRAEGAWAIHFHRDVVGKTNDYPVAVTFPTQVAGRYVPASREIQAGLVILVLALIAGGFLNWTWKGPSARATTAHRPDGLSLPEAAVLLGRGETMAYLPVIVDLAQRGHLTITHEQKDSVFGTSDVATVAVHPQEDDRTDFENDLLATLRSCETLDDFWMSESEFQSDGISRIWEHVEDAGWVVRHSLRSLLLFVAGAGAIIAGFVVAFTASSPPVFLGGWGLGGAGIVAWMGAFRNWVYTEEGARRAGAVTGFITKKTEEIERLRDSSPHGAAEELERHLAWLLLHDEVTASWIEDLLDDLQASGASVDLPAGFNSHVDGAGTAAALTTLLIVSSSSGASAGGAGAAGGAAGGGGGAAGAG